MFEIGKLGRLTLGFVNENEARVIDIDMTGWLEDFPDGNIGLLVKRPWEDNYYPADLKREGNIVIWKPTRADMMIDGEGEAQFVLTNAEGVELRSRVVGTKINASLGGTAGAKPAPEDSFVQKVINAAAQAEAAVEKMPRISKDETWLLWNAAAGEYVDSKVTAKGVKGDKGDPGPSGKGLEILGAYNSEEDLKAEHPTGEIGDAYLVNGDLYLWDEKTGAWVNAGHIQGAPGKDGEDGYTPVKGTDYWTAADRQSMVNDVLAALPVYNGEVSAV